MAEVIKTYIDKVSPQKFIGIKYSDKDRDERNTFGSKWDEWMQNGYFDVICKNNKDYEFDENTYACVKMSENHFEYWIGLVAPVDANIPEGYGFIDLPAGDFGVCWFKGSHNKADVYFEQNKCAEALINAGINILPESFFFERYVPERFMEDKNGNVILDVCILTPQST